MSRGHHTAVVVERAEVAEGVHRLTMACAPVASEVRAGQFVNIRIHDDGWDPLLRRPFSVSRVDGDRIEIVFNIVGAGTRAMATYGPGRPVDLLGPLGRPFDVDAEFRTAVLVGGGLGVAPLPLLTEALRQRGKPIVTLVGARSAGHLYTEHLDGVEVATDDGSRGFRGTVVDLLRDRWRREPLPAPMIFACGPTPMLRALAAAAAEGSVPCQLSLEGEMACGIGLCQGCPVERIDGPKRYALVCTEGPTFRSEEVRP